MERNAASVQRWRQPGRHGVLAGSSGEELGAAAGCPSSARSRMRAKWEANILSTALRRAAPLDDPVPCQNLVGASHMDLPPHLRAELDRVAVFQEERDQACVLVIGRRLDGRRLRRGGGLGFLGRRVWCDVDGQRLRRAVGGRWLLAPRRLVVGRPALAAGLLALRDLVAPPSAVPARVPVQGILLGRAQPARSPRWSGRSDRSALRQSRLARPRPVK